ncbi:MAG: acyltransferase [Proteobacteria bacterium]|nr:acyltransferase [Pseudomonadota bacterium]
MTPSLLYIYRIFSALLPETRFFPLKASMLRQAGLQIGSNVRICSSAVIFGSGKLTIGSNTWIGHQVLLCASSSILIGENVDISPGVYVGTGTHEVSTGERAAGPGFSKDIIIGNGAWIGARAVILPGVTIGAGAMVAAGSLVNRDVDAGTMVAGNPATRVRQLGQH